MRNALDFGKVFGVVHALIPHPTQDFGMGLGIDGNIVESIPCRRGRNRPKSVPSPNVNLQGFISVMVIAFC